MSKTAYKWNSTPPATADVYPTRRNESKYLTLRYWDGSAWFEIAHTQSRGGIPFSWTAKSVTRRPEWVNRLNRQIFLRRINANIGNIQWGTPYKVYEPKEVIEHLVKTGVLPKNWRDAYQDEMREAKARSKSI